jgi:hypothetical protein
VRRSARGRSNLTGSAILGYASARALGEITGRSALRPPALLRDRFEMSTNKQLAKIEELRIAFMDGTRRNLMRKETRSWKELLKGNSSALSSGRKSDFNRAKEFAVAILKKLGSEVSLLVLSSMNRTQMDGYHKKEQLLKALAQWWNAVPHPPALSDAAKCLDINDEEVDHEEVDAITPKIMQPGKSTSELQVA